MGSPIDAAARIYDLWLQRKRDQVAAEKTRAEIARLGEQHRMEYGYEEPVTIPHGATGLAGSANRPGLIARSAPTKESPYMMSNYGGGESGVVNMPNVQIGTRRVPGLRERGESRLEAGEVREGLKPGSQHDRWMQGKPDTKRIAELSKNYPHSAQPHINELIAKVDGGDIKTRWEAYQFVKQKRPTLLRDVQAEFEQIQADNRAPGEASKFVGLALNHIAADDFAEDMFGFPSERRPSYQKEGLVSTEERGLTTRRGAYGQTQRLSYGQTEEGAKELAGIRARGTTARKIGSTRRITRGDEVITEEWDGEEWNEIGRGERFKETQESEEMKTRRRAATLKDVAKAEDLINTSPNDPGIVGYITTFNSLANKPYMYIQAEEPGRVYGTNLRTRKVQLPKIAGKQATAREVTATAEEEGMTVEEVLRHIGALK